MADGLRQAAGCRAPLASREAALLGESTIESPLVLPIGRRQLQIGGSAILLDRKIAMSWGIVEVEPEVREWLLGLTDEEFGHVASYIDLLHERGALLDQPYTRQLRGKLRELRFHLGRGRRRVSYYIAGGRRMVLLTVLRKTKMREAGEVARAEAAMVRCITEGHTAED